MKQIILFVLLFASFAGFAQVTNEFEPRSWSMIEKSSVQMTPVILPAVDVDALIEEDQEIAKTKFNKALRVGEDIEVDLDLYNSGSWTTLKNGDRLWRLNVVAKGAKFTRAIFDLYSLPEGAEMYLYNNDKSDRIGPYTSNENQEDGILGSWIIEGDNLWIEYYEPARVKGLGRLSVSSITYGYIDLFKKNDGFAKLNESGSCNVDVLCNPNTGSPGIKDWSTARDNHINSVARILIPRGNQAFLCTGSIINSTAQNATPYFLTANHCLDTFEGAGSSFNANNWTFGFQWYANDSDKRCASFQATGASNPVPVRILTGAQLKANNDDSDVALFLLNQNPPRAWNLYYAGWDRSGAIPTQQLGVHHPRGDIMKISRNDQAADLTTIVFNGQNQTLTWKVADWDYGVTEGGSSGSFLLNQDDQIIGQLAGGGAECLGTTDNGDPDFYGRFDVSWNSGLNASTRLRDWLDPSATGAITQKGAYYQTLSSDEIIKPSLEIKIYPNPSTGLYIIESELPTTYQVYNLNGQLMINGSTSVTSDQLDLTPVATGLYFIKITAGNQTITRKLVKQ
ncbi:T9SS type A sorting domain-containing protein [Nonlabens antarcticus]|uniref:T9SS type A sorting domain-containing protein n=1 Tax=Nonlabens antarcticus TaxID=392714 RepID=UPI001891B5C3|nr:T9SS type A sorting domain-containing protein [Nonlabens antarcticus]